MIECENKRLLTKKNWHGNLKSDEMSRFCFCCIQETKINPLLKGDSKIKKGGGGILHGTFKEPNGQKKSY